jgi:hypothetical protein
VVEGKYIQYTYYSSYPFFAVLKFTSKAKNGERGSDAMNFALAIYSIDMQYYLEVYPALE